MIPTRLECLKTIENQNLPKGLLKHIFLVNKSATFIAKTLKKSGYGVSVELIDRASLLHDFTKIKERELGKHHTELAVDFFKKNNWDELIKPVKKHFAESVLDKKTYPKTLEEKIVYYADKIAAQKIVNIEFRMQDWYSRYPEFQKTAQKSKPHMLKIEKEILSKLNMNFNQLKLKINKIK